MPSRVPSSVGDESGDTLIDSSEPVESNGARRMSRAKSIDQSVKKPVKKDAMAETKAEGGVKWTVLVLYLKSMGPWCVSLPMPPLIFTNLSGGFGLWQS